MCQKTTTPRGPSCTTYRCASGCVHLVWNNVTLHFFAEEWDLLARTVRDTDRVIREERERPRPFSPTM